LIDGLDQALQQMGRTMAVMLRWVIGEERKERGLAEPWT
jgi:hypothetical protein